MKNIKLYVIGVIVAFVICLLMLFINVNKIVSNEKSDSHKAHEVKNEVKKDDEKDINLEFKYYKVGYEKNYSNVVITSYTELVDYVNNNATFYYDDNGVASGSDLDVLLDDYNEYYFNNNNLAIMYISTSSGSIYVNSVKGHVDGDSISIKYEIGKPEVGTMDMSGILLTVSVDKNIINLS